MKHSLLFVPNLIPTSSLLSSWSPANDTVNERIVGSWRERDGYDNRRNFLSNSRCLLWSYFSNSQLDVTFPTLIRKILKAKTTTYRSMLSSTIRTAHGRDGCRLASVASVPTTGCAAGAIFSIDHINYEVVLKWCGSHPKLTVWSAPGNDSFPLWEWGIKSKFISNAARLPKERYLK